jgi:hypothetical protein
VFNLALFCYAVDSYLNALLSTGLSSEYTRSEAEAKPTAKEDADASLVAKYYVNQILSLDEDSIKDSWLKVRGFPCPALLTGSGMLHQMH